MTLFSRYSEPQSRSVRATGCWWLLPLLVVLAVVPAFGRSDDAVGVTVDENTPQRIVIHYQVGDYTAMPVLVDGVEYQHLTLPGESNLEIAGAPSLPRVCRSIIIPDDQEMAVNVISAKYYEVADVLVEPSKGIIYRNTNPADVPYTFGEAYQTGAFYPAEVAALREPYIMRDWRGLVVEVNPLRYNPVTRILRVYTDVALEVVAIGPGKVNVLDRAMAPTEPSLAFHQTYKHHFINYDPAPRYAPVVETGGLLIICYDSWLPNIQPLVDHKNSIGIPTTAVGVATIPGGTTSTAIKNYIQAQYNQGNLSFVLLVGDSAQIATPTASGGSSDPSYAKLAGSDNYPDAIIGRFSAETAAHVDTQVLRTIEYETMPATEQAWFKRGTGIASTQGAGIGDDGEADNVHMDHIRADLLGYGYTVVDQIYDPSGTAAQVSTALNAGRGIINYCGHGSTVSWSTTGFSSTHVAALTNDNMLPFIISVACVNGQFAGYTCFAEAWLRSTHNGEPIGAIGAYMSSINQSWAPPMIAQDETVDLLCAEAYFSFGALCYAGSCQMIDEQAADGVEMYDTWHIFGDPSVRVFGTAIQPTGLQVLPTSGLSATGYLGGPFTPSSLGYTLKNYATTPIDYQVTNGEPWVSLTNATGTLAAGAQTTVTVTINGDADTLAYGQYTDVVNFVNTTNHDGDTTRPVSLDVQYPPPAITTTTLPLGFVNHPYTPVQLQATGGQPPLNWLVLPAGAYNESDLGSSQFSAVGTAQGWRGDDSSWSYALPFAFPFYGTNYTSVWVCSNGFLDFTSSSAPYSNSTSGLTSAVRIAPLWDDLETDQQTDHDIYIDTGTSGQVTIRWQGATYSYTGTGYPVNVAVTLYSDGRIRFHYGDGNTNLTPTIGISRGTGSEYTLSSYNGLATLTNSNSHEFIRPASLPAGMSLSGAGVLSGTPTELGTFSPTFRVTDGMSRSDQKTLSLVVEDLPPPPYDCDGDGLYDLTEDLPCFVNALLGIQPPTGWGSADLNDDGQVDGADVQVFVNLNVP